MSIRLVMVALRVNGKKCKYASCFVTDDPKEVLLEQFKKGLPEKDLANGSILYGDFVLKKKQIEFFELCSKFGLLKTFADCVFIPIFSSVVKMFEDEKKK